MLAQETVTTTPSLDRRAHRRFSARELTGLRTARVKYGQQVSVIDLSEGGVLFETTGELRPDSTLVLEFAGPSRTYLVPSRVVRCQSLAPLDDRARSEGACAVRRPLPVEDLVGDAAASSPESSQPGSDTAGSTTWHQVVGRYRDGRLVRGYTNDFSPSRPYLHVSPAPGDDDTQFVSMIQLDALLFVRDAQAALMSEDGILEAPAATAAQRGRQVALLLPNGRELVGSTLNYNADGAGFFVHPLDSQSGAVRVFVTQSGIRNVRSI